MFDAILDFILSSLSNKRVAVVATVLAALVGAAYLFFDSNKL